MHTRIDLHETLLSLCPNVYFQPPESVKLQFPCYIYSLSNFYQQFADDSNYVMKKRYEIKYITKNPDDPLIEETIKGIPRSRMDNHYTADGLNHYVYYVYV